MNTLEEVNDFVRNGHQEYLPHVSIDSVIFGYHEQKLKILLLKWKGLDDWGYRVGLLKEVNC